MNWLVHGLAALIPMIIGMIWYNPKVMGTIWMRESGMTEEKIKTGNMGLIYGTTLVLAFILSMAYKFGADHVGAFGAFFRPIAEHGLGMDAASEVGLAVQAAINSYGLSYNTFSHGAFHGFFMAFIVIMPVMGTNCLFERRSFKYFMVNFGYWLITFTLMLGFIAQFNYSM